MKRKDPSKQDQSHRGSAPRNPQFPCCLWQSMATNHGALLRAELRINKTHMKHYIQVLLRCRPAPCLHYFSPGYVNLHTTPLQSRKQNLISMRRWSKGQGRGLPAPGSGTRTATLSALLRWSVSQTVVPGSLIPILVQAPKVSANVGLEKPQTSSRRQEDGTFAPNHTGLQGLCPQST